MQLMLQWQRRFVSESSICSRKCELAPGYLQAYNSQLICRSGIGGGGFMTVRIPPKDSKSKSEVYNIDFRETAPALANTTMYASNPRLALFGGLAVGVPGEVRGLAEAHSRWGSLPWERLVQPSVTLAQGWHVDKELGRRIPVRLLSLSTSWRYI